MAGDRILIVEDEWLVAQGISENLRDLGYEVAGVAATGEEALRLAAATAPDVVLMDILLQGEMDGIDTAGLLRQRWGVPVVYLTAYADAATLERAKVAEPYGYILKPFEVRELHSAIEIALYKSRAEKRLQHLNQVLRAIRNVNQIIVQEKDRQRLIERACHALTEGRGYSKAWIALVGEDGKVAAAAAAGTDCDIPFLLEMLGQGELPVCGRRAWEQEGLVMMEDRLTVCTGCPCFQDLPGIGVLVTRLVHHERWFGVLAACLPTAMLREQEEVDLFVELGNDLALALHNLELEAQQQQAREALRQSEVKFSSIFRHAPVLMTLSTLEEGHYLEVNDKFTEVTGYSREEALGRTPVELGWVSLQDRQRLKAALMQNQCVKNVGVTLTARDGRKVYGLYNGVVLSLEGQGVLLSIVDDITALKETQTALERAISIADERHRETTALLTATKMVLQNHPFETTARAIFEVAKQTIGARAGYVALLKPDGKENELLFLDSGGLPCTVDPTLPMPIRGLRAEAYRQGGTVFDNDFWQSEYVSFMPPGHVALDNVLFAPLRVHGKTAGLIGLANKAGGFTEQDASLATAFGELAAIALINARTLEALKDSEEKYRTLIEFANDAIALLDADTGEVLEVNRKVEELLGRDRQDIIGRHHTAFQPPEAEALYRTLFVKHVQTGGLPHEEVELMDAGGARIPVDLSSKLLEVQGRKVLLIMMRDLRERRRVEEERRRLQAQIIQTQKMEALGTLAGGIAHDFNNILAAMLGLAELAYYKLPKDLPEREHIRNILKAGERAQELVHQILSFSRQRQLERKPLSLAPLVKEAVKFLRASLPSTINIHLEVERELPAVVADAVQIHQVVMNLATNAAHAMEEHGGVLGISLKEKHLGPEEVSPYEGLLPGTFVELTISDTGHGIAPEALPQIFDPFFTTKEPGKGTGLGLAVVYGIVVSHGGFIRVASTPGAGTTCKVYFPASATAEEKPDTEAAAPVPVGRGRILFVDDDQDFYPIGKRLLEVLGYEVTAHISSQAALKAFREAPHDFDLLITDQTMPGLTGLELAAACTAIRPGLPVILCTGFSEQVTPVKVAQSGVSEVIMKPFSMRELGALIQKILKEKNGWGR